MTAASAAAGPAAVTGDARALRTRVLRNPSVVAGLTLLAIVAALSILAPLLTVFGPTDRVPGGLASAFIPPGSQYLLGTDGQGRDVMSRVMYGGRISLVLGICAVSIGVVVGATIGAIAGIFGGKVDALLMRVVDMMLAIPGLLLAVGVVAALGPGLPQIVLAVALTNVPIFARLLRTSLLGLVGADFVIASRTMGASRWRLLSRHMLPNALTPMLVQAALALAVATVDIAALGYLGLGPPDPAIAEWGTMLTEASRYFRSAPYLVLFPGLAIAVTAIAFNLLAEGLRESLDPRLVK